MAKRNLHLLPKFSDRWSHVYLEHGGVDVDSSSLLFYDKAGETRIPIDQICLLMLGPGTRISHASVRSLADNNCLICWTGEHGVRTYAHSTGGTHSAHRLLRQVMLWADPQERMSVIRRMYLRRFPDPLPEDASIETIRAMEGIRVKRAYEKAAKKYGINWAGREYDQSNWSYSDPVNRSLSTANACLYGICNAAIVSAGYSPAIGFVHTGKMLSFVYDIADLYKTDITIPVAFQCAKGELKGLDRLVRIRCRDMFFEKKLLKRIIPDIAEVLNARDDLDERPGELEGRAVSLADRAEERRLLGESIEESAREALGDDDSESGQGSCDDDMDE